MLEYSDLANGGNACSCGETEGIEHGECFSCRQLRLDEVIERRQRREEGR